MTTRRGQVLVPTEITADSWEPIGPGGLRRDVIDASPNAEELPSFLAGTFEVLFLHGPQRKIAGEDGE